MSVGRIDLFSFPAAGSNAAEKGNPAANTSAASSSCSDASRPDEDQKTSDPPCRSRVTASNIRVHHCAAMEGPSGLRLSSFGRSVAFVGSNKLGGRASRSSDAVPGGPSSCRLVVGAPDEDAASGAESMANAGVVRAFDVSLPARHHIMDREGDNDDIPHPGSSPEGRDGNPLLLRQVREWSGTAEGGGMGLSLAAAGGLLVAGQPYTSTSVPDIFWRVLVADLGGAAAWGLALAAVATSLLLSTCCCRFSSPSAANDNNQQRHRSYVHQMVDDADGAETPFLRTGQPCGDSRYPDAAVLGEELGMQSCARRDEAPELATRRSGKVMQVPATSAIWMARTMLVGLLLASSLSMACVAVVALVRGDPDLLRGRAGAESRKGVLIAMPAALAVDDALSRNHTSSSRPSRSSVPSAMHDKQSPRDVHHLFVQHKGFFPSMRESWWFSRDSSSAADANDAANLEASSTAGMLLGGGLANGRLGSALSAAVVQQQQQIGEKDNACLSTAAARSRPRGKELPGLGMTPNDATSNGAGWDAEHHDHQRRLMSREGGSAVGIFPDDGQNHTPGEYKAAKVIMVAAGEPNAGGADLRPPNHPDHDGGADDDDEGCCSGAVHLYHLL